MTVGKSGEYAITCGGMSGLQITVRWAEQIDIGANASVLAVTGLAVTADSRVGRYSLNGTVAVNSSVILRGENDVLGAQVVSEGIAAEETGGSYPYLSSVLPHNADGSGTATVTVNLTGVHRESGQHYYASGSFSVGLTVFPSVSGVTCLGGEIGSMVPIGIYTTVSDSVHTLRYVCGSEAGIIAEGLPMGRYEWSVPMSVCYGITESLKGVCHIFCDTYRNGELMGTSECIVYLLVPDGVGLTVSGGWLRFVPDNSGTAAAELNCFIQGFSRVQAVFDGSLISCEEAYGGGMGEYSMIVNDRTYDAPYLSDVLHSAGALNAFGVVTDSRGRDIMEAHQLEVLPYDAPVIGSAAVFRCDESGSPAESGSCVSVAAECSFYPLGGRNSVALTARLRSVDGEWSEGVSLTTGETAVLWTDMLNAEQSYEVAIHAVDVLGSTAELTVMIPTARAFFHGREGGRGAAFGKYAETDDLLEVAWSLKTNGNLTVEGNVTIDGRQLSDWIYPVGGVCTCAEGADPAVIYGGEWSAADDTVCRWVRTQ